MLRACLVVFISVFWVACGTEDEMPQGSALPEAGERDMSRRVAVVDAGPLVTPDSDLPIIESSSSGGANEGEEDESLGDPLDTEMDAISEADAANDQWSENDENSDSDEVASMEDDHIFDPAAPGTWAQFEFNGGIQDVSGLGHEGVLIGGAFVDTDFGQGLQVGDASHGFDWSVHSAALSHPYTIEMVLTPDVASATFSKLLSPDDDSEDGWYLYSEGFRTYPINGGTAGEEMIPFGARSYLAIVSASPSEVYVYVNGQSVTEEPIESQLNAPPEAAIFFRDDGPVSRYETLHAVVDALRISAVSRSDDEIEAVQERLEER